MFLFSPVVEQSCLRNISLLASIKHFIIELNFKLLAIVFFSTIFFAQYFPLYRINNIAIELSVLNQVFIMLVFLLNILFQYFFLYCIVFSCHRHSKNVITFITSPLVCRGSQGSAPCNFIRIFNARDIINHFHRLYIIQIK